MGQFLDLIRIAVDPHYAHDDSVDAKRHIAAFLRSMVVFQLVFVDIDCAALLNRFLRPVMIRADS